MNPLIAVPIWFRSWTRKRQYLVVDPLEYASHQNLESLIYGQVVSFDPETPLILSPHQDFQEPCLILIQDLLICGHFLVDRIEGTKNYQVLQESNTWKHIQPTVLSLLEDPDVACNFWIPIAENRALAYVQACHPPNDEIPDEASKPYVVVGKKLLSQQPQYFTLANLGFVDPTAHLGYHSNRKDAYFGVDNRATLVPLSHLDYAGIRLSGVMASTHQVDCLNIYIPEAFQKRIQKA